MQAQKLQLDGATPGQRHQLTVLRFGTPGAAPRATIQAALHADEVPGLLVAQCLREQLLALSEASGVEEFIVTTNVQPFDKRLRSFELLSEALAEVPAEA